jgi:hypothetical protein
MKRKKTSTVWDHISEGTEKFSCKHCSITFSKQTSTSTMLKHVQKQHTNIEISNSPQKKRKDSYLDPKIQEKATKDLLKFIIDDYQAFIIVENEFFQTFLNNFGYECPGKTYVKNEIVKMFQEAKKTISEYLKNLGSLVSITLDLWTSDSNIPYIGITVHWIENDWKLISITLDFVECPYPHDGESLAVLVLNIFKDFGIISKILGITTDNAPNMATFYRSLFEKIKIFSPQITDFGCGCHIINLAVQNGISELSSNIEKLREVNKKLKDSPKLFQEFKEIYDHFKPNFPFKTPKLDIKTRWNSLYYMLRDSIEMKEIYNKLNQTKLSENEWDLMSEYLEFLELFEQASNFISGSKYPTISVLFKIISILYCKTENYDTNNSIIKESASKMFVLFEKYWTELKLSGIIATFLDPRFKNEIITTYPEFKEIGSSVYNLYNQKNNSTQTTKEQKSKYSKLNINSR